DRRGQEGQGARRPRQAPDDKALGRGVEKRREERDGGRSKEQDLIAFEPAGSTEQSAEALSRVLEHDARRDHGRPRGQQAQPGGEHQAAKIERDHAHQERRITPAREGTEAEEEEQRPQREAIEEDELEAESDAAAGAGHRPAPVALTRSRGPHGTVTSWARRNGSMGLTTCSSKPASSER